MLNSPMGGRFLGQTCPAREASPFSAPALPAARLRNDSAVRRAFATCAAPPAAGPAPLALAVAVVMAVAASRL